MNGQLTDASIKSRFCRAEEMADYYQNQNVRPYSGKAITSKQPCGRTGPELLPSPPSHPIVQIGRY